MKRDSVLGTAFRAFVISGLTAASLLSADVLAGAPGDVAGGSPEVESAGAASGANSEAEASAAEGELMRSVPKQPKAQGGSKSEQVQTSHLVRVKPGQTQVLRISGGLPNRIVTPYRKPELVTNVAHEAWAVGGVLYVLPKAKGQVMAGFIQDASGEWAIPVVMEPAEIPPQEIVLDDPRFEPVAEGLVEKTEKASSHSESVVDLLLTALREREIPGFRQVKREGLEAVYVGPLRMEPVMSQIRGNVRVDRFQIVHEGMETRKIHEPSFAQPGAIGVMVFPPMTSIAPNQTATVLVARRVR